LHALYTANLDFIICDYINTNCIIDIARKNHLDTLLFSYNLSDIIKVPTRVQLNSVRAIDNILIAISQMGNCTAVPVVHGLSYHNAPLITVSTNDIQLQSHQLKTVRKIKKYTIPDFLTKLSYEILV